MSFIAGAFLVGLPLAAAPILIHLLNRRRRNVVRWGAMRFLVEATTRRRRMWRIDDLLLMLLRVLAVAAFVFALAQPLVSFGLLSSRGARDVIIVLDASMSASRVGDDGSVFDRELDAARELIGRLGEGDTVRVLLASGAPQWLTPVAVPVNEDSMRELAARLETVKPTAASADMLRCVQEAMEAESSSRTTTRVVVVVTDGRAWGWRTEAAEGWKRIRQIAEESTQPTTVNVVDVGATDGAAAANLSVESVVASRTLAARDQPVVLTATVRNRGAAAADGCLVAWFEGDMPLGVGSLSRLAPGQSTTVSIEHVFATEGAREVSCRLEREDELPMDNAGRVVVEVVGEAPVLVVTSGGDSVQLDDDTAYALAALGCDSTGQPRSAQVVFRPHVVRVEALASERLSDYYCVILANVPTPSEASAAALTQYVQEGGGLWIVLGDRADAATFNARCFIRGAGLSPLAIGDAAGDAEDWDRGLSILPPAANHRATALMGDTERLDIDRVRVRRRWPLMRTESDKGVSVLLAVDGGLPLAVENRLGRGRVVVQGLPLGARWSNLPACHVFVAMLHEWLWYLCEAATPERNLHPGDTAVARFPAGRAVDEATVTTPDGQTLPAQAMAADGATRVAFADTLTPGGYRIAVTFEDGTAASVPFVVMRDAEESDLEPLGPERTQLLAEVSGLRFEADGLAEAQSANQAPQTQPIWWHLLVGLLGVMAAELVLAWRATAGRMVTSPGVSMKAR